MGILTSSIITKWAFACSASAPSGNGMSRENHPYRRCYWCTILKVALYSVASLGAQHNVSIKHCLSVTQQHSVVTSSRCCRDVYYANDVSVASLGHMILHDPAGRQVTPQYLLAATAYVSPSIPSSSETIQCCPLPKESNRGYGQSHCIRIRIISNGE
jgi:hypothetical protein